MKKIMMNNILLWLDDYRNPFLDVEGKVQKMIYSINSNKEIHWVLNYDEFTQWINKYGLPIAISFDHDLADEHYTPSEYCNDYDESKKYQDSKVYKEKTGMDCAKWLIDYCIDNNLKLPEIINVHSANPVGADNILNIINNFRKHQSK